MTAPRPEDRRRFGRIHLHPPYPARLGDTRVDVVDLSLAGARITSVARFAPGSRLELTFDWEQSSVDVACHVIRCTLAQFAKAPGEKSIYQTGLQILETVGDSGQVLRQLIASTVVQALEEQRANALGLPPVGPLIDMDENNGRYRRCELTDGKWRRVETSNPDQPPEGFTISTSVETKYVDLLCETYQRAGEEGRRLTKILAQLSVTKGEAVPVRRYVP